MRANSSSDAAKKEPSPKQTTRDPLRLGYDNDSASLQSVSQHSTPHVEELNLAGSSSSAAHKAVRSSHVTLQSHYGEQPLRTQHISGEPNASMHCSSNPTTHPNKPQGYRSQMRRSSSGALTPIPMEKSKAPNSMHAPRPFDAQLLSSPWPGGYQLPTTQPLPSPTRAGGGAGVATSSYWNVPSSPTPYPCDSPTAHGNGVRYVSLSVQSLLQQQQHQHQQLNGNEDSSPMQLSISTLGRESSLIGGSASAFASPGATGMVHSAILDAPLQVSLVPPPYHSDHPYFSFGDSITQSNVFTQSTQTSMSCGHSIYQDTMLELSQHTQGLAHLYSVLNAESTRPAARECTPTSLADAATLSVSTTPLTVEVAGQPHQTPQRLMSRAFSGPGSGAIDPPKLPDGTLRDWWRLEQTSPTSPPLQEPLTARPNEQSDEESDGRRVVQKHGPPQEEEGDLVDDSRCSDTPEGLPSTYAESTAVPPHNGVPHEGAQQQQQQQDDERSGMKRLHDTSINLTESIDVNSTEPHNAAAELLSRTNFASNEMHSKATTAAAATTSAAPWERKNAGGGLQMATPLNTYSRRQRAQPNMPAVALHTVDGTLGVTDAHVFLPSPVDQGAQGFAPLRDGLTRRSPSEHSTSMLSPVPNIGVCQASSMLFSAWQSAGASPLTAPTFVAALSDFHEVLRLLRSDIANVDSRVSMNEHTVRHWIGCTLSALLHLTVEISHSVPLSAVEEVTENEAKPEQGLTYTQLHADVLSGVASCVETLRNTIPAIQHDRNIVEPLLLTSMLARGAIISLLCSLEKTYNRSESQFAATNGVVASRPMEVHDAGAAAPIVLTTTNPITAVPANRRDASVVVHVPAPLTTERIDEIMNSDLLAQELGCKWLQLTSKYNRNLLRYLFLRVLHAQLRCADGSKGSGEAHSTDDGNTHRSSSASSVHDSTAATLRTIESAWTDDQLKQWSFLFQRSTSQVGHKGDVTGDDITHADEAGTRLFREVFCPHLPSYKVVTETFSSFRGGECWRRWYVLLGQMMECTFHVQDKTDLFDYVARQFTDAPDPYARAALRAVSVGQITLQQVEESLESVKAALISAEEEGKARRVTILQLLLRRIFVVGVVASVHRTLGKDAVVSDAQLAAYVQVQRKSLEEVEAQLTAEHTDGATYIKYITDFLSRFASVSRVTSRASVTALDGTSEGRLCDSAATTPLPSRDPQWNIFTVGPLAPLLAGTRSRNDDANDFGRNESAEAPATTTRDALALVRDVSARIMDTISTLCVLLQSDVDVPEAKRHYRVDPTKIPTQSTRALRRLQASLIETHRATMVCLACLHLD
ncbi:hypothetical protein ABB37_03328 [Leptomonas pyrrhocoris]|uniref:Uncharacterized protein n=1 Tax=Leptomonas pyrrhocoris TaxID=157538 RepID=A0A0N0DWU4_LEPPY|nr:hypothetical protein ABB37_03328 [Leptomonas pyrrhocoris]KPA82208.1 hypothetical protein ABB37_03328 [Leptomonas pyrrhocoris]|eukprot:XP_015660647.1 hypothetical protein ABB37_03328 [Leptomonas pyrrhocoris]